MLWYFARSQKPSHSKKTKQPFATAFPEWIGTFRCGKKLHSKSKRNAIWYTETCQTRRMAIQIAPNTWHGVSKWKLSSENIIKDETHWPRTTYRVWRIAKYKIYWWGKSGIWWYSENLVPYICDCKIHGDYVFGPFESIIGGKSDNFTKYKCRKIFFSE